MFSVIAVKEPIEGRHANLADFRGWFAGLFFVPLCVPEGQLVSSGRHPGKLRAYRVAD
jgi:hypothetical protein